jgi:hypothetical protein
MSIKDVKFGNQKLQVKQFSLDMMVENPSILLVAKRGNGKSWICRTILRHFDKIPVGLVIAPTEKLADPPFYSEFVPETYIHYDFKSETIERLLYRQDIMIEKAKKYKKKDKIIDPRSFILMDDCLSKKKAWAKDETVLELLYNGRHYKIMYILTMQSILGIGPDLRTNFDYIFLLADDFYSNLKKIYEHYAGMFPSFDSFRKVFTELTKEFGAMVIINRGARADWSDKIMWFKASYEKTNDMIGCKQYIENHEKNYIKDWRIKQKFSKMAVSLNDISKKNDNIVIVKEEKEDE